MSIWQRRIATSPEERSAERIKDLERGLAAKARNSQMPAMQRGTSSYSGANVNIGPGTSSAALVSVSVAIPTNVTQVWCSYYVYASQFGGTGAIGISEPTDFGAGVQLASWTQAGGMRLYPQISTAVVNTVTYTRMRTWINLYHHEFVGAAPTTGTRTYSLFLSVTGGGATAFAGPDPTTGTPIVLEIYTL